MGRIGDVEGYSNHRRLDRMAHICNADYVMVMGTCIHRHNIRP